ncbi:casein kinase 2 regulatory subunit [Malassezia caprae]|uniref:Casein kinase II subunit beta n=1 Tax=Malassezia caprae TaxID=1381934 RepID=A0AAF0E547_9BASI|nr:casein kinase 2 regulatory subunit [Malassezia caprae]
MASAEQPSGSVGTPAPSETEPMYNSLNLSESNRMEDLSELAEEEEFYEVAEEFIEDDFNLTGLNFLVPFYKEALEMILDIEPQTEDSLKIPDISIVESSAELLYGLIHQRYIITRQGMQQMVEKFDHGHFGVCPRVYCNSQYMLPCGSSDLPGLDTVKLYCPNFFPVSGMPVSRAEAGEAPAPLRPEA